jgi:hypothetical protein
MAPHLHWTGTAEIPKIPNEYAWLVAPERLWWRWQYKLSFCNLRIVIGTPGRRRRSDLCSYPFDSGYLHAENMWALCFQECFFSFLEWGAYTGKELLSEGPNVCALADVGDNGGSPVSFLRLRLGNRLSPVVGNRASKCPCPGPGASRTASLLSRRKPRFFICRESEMQGPGLGLPSLSATNQGPRKR